MLRYIKARTADLPHGQAMASTSPRKRLVAVVEDDPAVLDSLHFTLDVQGYDVCLFNQGGKAIASDEILAADCLLIDYGLPDMNGLILLSQLRSRGLTCAAVIIASNPGALPQAQTRRAGAAVIEKSQMGEAMNDLIRAVVADRAA